MQQIPPKKKIGDIPPSLNQDIEEWPGGASEGKHENPPDIPEIKRDNPNVGGDKSAGRKPARLASGTGESNG